MSALSRTRLVLLVCALFTMCGFSYADDCYQGADTCGFLNHQGQVSFYSYGTNNQTAFFGINGAGDIVGSTYNYGSGHALYLHNGTATLFDYPGAYITASYGINNSGQIAGFYRTTYSDPAHGFVDSQGTYSSFDYPGASETYGSGINDAGQIGGTYTDSGGKFHGFLKDGNTYTSIDYPGQNLYTEVWGINNKAETVGFYYTGGTNYGFVDSNGVFTTLSYPGAPSTQAWAINDSGEVVGNYSDNQGYSHGFVYYDGHYMSVDYGKNTYIFGVNNDGDFVGYVDPGEVPEPSSIVLLTTAILGSFVAKRFLK